LGPKECFQTFLLRNGRQAVVIFIDYSTSV
jgi:hypothetical protein